MLEDCFDLPAAPLLPVRLDLTGRGTLGKCKTRLLPRNGTESTIHLNAQYAAAYDGFADTVLHEVCHAITWARYDQAGRPGSYVVRRGQHKWVRPTIWDSHGYEWKRAMRRCGGDPSRLENVPADVLAQVKPARTVTRINVGCGCPGANYVVTKVKLTNLAKRGAVCRHCRLPFEQV